MKFKASNCKYVLVVDFLNYIILQHICILNGSQGKASLPLLVCEWFRSLLLFLDALCKSSVLYFFAFLFLWSGWGHSDKTWVWRKSFFL